MALEGWSCQKLSEEFPEAAMRREYDWDKNPDDKNIQKLGDTSWIEKAESGEESAIRKQMGGEKVPSFAPFYWGVREAGRKYIAPKKDVARIKKLIEDSVPTFMDKKLGTSMFSTTEFWLGANGTGARAHMDSHCIPTLSFVLHGERRWRLGPVPRMPKGSHRSPPEDVFYDDGVAYKLGWKPMFEFTVKEGEAILFPPGWLHESLNTDPGCTVALTTQFDMYSDKYFRNYYPRLKKVGDVEHCLNMERLAGFPNNMKLLKTHEEVEELGKKIYDKKKGKFTPRQINFNDLDEDGQVTKDEFVKVYTQLIATEKEIRKEKKKEQLKPDIRWDADGHEEL
eukprot:TRINITY_DN52030_c0_g1_i1.p1 TRINITY_DN52030_c0_g1~~TRINITY_DN52030_c0_g1_i1.p1  ORF type:complete len:391 (+),score=89.21 TRINITY_DN52030_c0_g1_i1:159-1175(+)